MKNKSFGEIYDNDDEMKFFKCFCVNVWIWLTPVYERIKQENQLDN